MKPFYTISANAGSIPEILIYEQIGKDWYGDGIGAKSFLEDLKALGNPPEINVRINSPGGSVFDGQAIYNALKRHTAKINVFIDGVAASIASVIAMAGDVVKMPENALMMIHDPSTGVYGTAEDMKKVLSALEKAKDTLVSAYNDKTKLDKDYLSELMTNETWMTATEAKKWGFIDEIDSPVEIAAHFDLSQFKNLPESFKALMENVLKPESLPSNQSEKGDEKTMDITKDLIAKEHPTIAEAFKAQGLEEGKAAGAEAERKRIQEVEAQLIPGHEALVNTLKFDGKTTGPEAAVQILAAEKQARGNVLASLQTESPQPLPAVATVTNSSVDPNLPLEDRCKAKWEKSPEVRDEFTSLAAFTAYTRAEESGRVKVFKK